MSLTDRIATQICCYKYVHNHIYTQMYQCLKSNFLVCKSLTYFCISINHSKESINILFDE